MIETRRGGRVGGWGGGWSVWVEGRGESDGVCVWGVGVGGRGWVGVGRWVKEDNY